MKISSTSKSCDKSDSPLINRTYHFHLILICFRGRPFIIANHSQGTWHSLKLIGNSIDRTYLVKRLVVAYIIGGQVNIEDHLLRGSKERVSERIARIVETGKWFTGSQSSDIRNHRQSMACLTFRIEFARTGMIRTSPSLKCEYEAYTMSQGINRR